MLSRTRVSHHIYAALLAGLCATVSVLLLASSAQAAITHLYTGISFGPGGPGPSSFGDVQGVTVDQRSGDVLVYDDSGGGRVYKFDAAGQPVDFSSTGTNVVEGVGQANTGEEQIAVDSSNSNDAGDIYVANNAEVRIYAESGAFLGTLSGGEMCGVAVDPSGNVYVGVFGQTARRYAPSTSPVTNADEDSSMGGLQGVCNVAADGNGNLYVASYAGFVDKYDALQFGSLSASGTLVDPQGKTLAVDPTSEAVFVDEQGSIAQYDGSVEPPSLQGTSGGAGAGALSGSFGVGVDHASGELYAGDESRVEVFGAGVTVPSVSTEATSGVSASEATLHGSVNPEGVEVISCVFEYGGQAGALTHSAPCSPSTPYTGSSAVAVSAQLSGLPAGSTYYYRVAATNANGTSYGTVETFQTRGPQVLDEEYERVRQHTATVYLIVNPEGLDTQIHVEYGTSTAYGSSTPSLDIGSGGSNVEEEIGLTGLTIGTTYHFRVVATNAEGTVQGADETFTTEPAERLGSVFITNVGASSADLSDSVDDFGVPASYHYEYGTTSAYGSATAAGSLLGAYEKLEAATTLTGLSPATTYHVQLVVESAAGTTRSPDVTLTTEAVTQPSAALPDGRVYEKVSPGANADGDVYPAVPAELASAGFSFTEEPMLVSPDGNAVAYMADPPEHGGIGREGEGYGNQYIARRGADGTWSAMNIEPPSSEFFDVPVFKGFSPDLSVGFVNSKYSTPLAPGAPGGGYDSLYAKNLISGEYKSLVTSKPPHRAPEAFGAAGTPTVVGNEIAYAGSSADLGHELFMANDTLTENAVDGGAEKNNLYDSSNGTTTLVNVLPDGSSEANATFGGPHLPWEGRENAPMLAHDISEDGSRIFWTDLNTGDLYVRENDTAPQSPIAEGRCTVPADACTVLIAEAAQYWNATPDGSKVLYTEGGELYERDLNTGQTIDLAPGGEVHGVVGASTDLSYVYFVAGAVLAPGAERQECGEGNPFNTPCNLYAIHIGEQIRFIGGLSRADNITKPESFGQFDGDWQGSLATSEAEATADGTHLLFTSQNSLTGYQNEEPKRELKNEEVFLYDFATGALHCVSCKPSGEAVGQAYAAAYLPVSHVDTALPRWISDNGNRVFFDTLAALVPQDVNKRTDVYEWERDGTGGCTDANGCIYMLSDGTALEGSSLIGASTSGDDVFIATRSKLVPEDENENVDIYDVRVDGARPPAPLQCTGTGCQGVPAAPPVFATPPSVTYNGVGNFEAPTPAVPAKAKPKKLTRAQQLASALKSCRAKRQKKKRAACEKQARKRYGAHTSVKRSAKRTSKKGNVR